MRILQQQIAWVNQQRQRQKQQRQNRLQKEREEQMHIASVPWQGAEYDRICSEASKKKKLLETSKKKIGVVVTTHGANGIFARQTLECFIRELPSNSFIVLFINESEDPITLGLADEFPQVKVVHVLDQTAGGGLTGTWNRGITLCMAEGAAVVVLANDDILFDCSVMHILYSASQEKSVPGKVFCPLTNEPGCRASEDTTTSPEGIFIKRGELLCDFNQRQLGATPRAESDFILEVGGVPGNCNGFFMVFPKRALLSNVHSRGYWFDPTIPFGGNETEWCKRFIKIGGRAAVVPRTFIYHYKNEAWRRGRPKKELCIYTVNTGGYEGNTVHLSDKLGVDCLYFTDTWAMMYGCIKRNILPFFVDTKDKGPKLVQRTIKAAPHLYLPRNYDISTYVDGNMKPRIGAKIGFHGKELNNLKVDMIHFLHNRVALHSHSVADEFEAVRSYRLETEENLNQMWSLINKDGFKPDQAMCSETGVLIRRHKNIERFGEHWVQLIKQCRRDQTSFNYLVWKHNVSAKVLPSDQRPIQQKFKHVRPHNRVVS